MSDLVFCGSLRKPAEARRGACGSDLNPYREKGSFRRGFAKVCGSLRKSNGITRSVAEAAFGVGGVRYTYIVCNADQNAVKHLRNCGAIMCGEVGAMEGCDE